MQYMLQLSYHAHAFITTYTLEIIMYMELCNYIEMAAGDYIAITTNR